MSTPDSQWELFEANDGLNLYRALSYHVNGRAELCRDVRNAVYGHLERALRNPKHPYRERCMRYEQQIHWQQNLLQANSSPLAAIRRAILEPDRYFSSSLLDLVADALQVQTTHLVRGIPDVYGLAS